MALPQEAAAVNSTFPPSPIQAAKLFVSLGGWAASTG